MRRILIKTVSPILTVCIMFCCAYVLPVSAKTTTVKADEQWSKSWSATPAPQIFNLRITETGLFNLYITDRKNTGYVTVEVFDTSTKQLNEYFHENVSSSGYVSPQFILSGGHTYEISCYYSKNKNYEYYYDADISLIFKKSSQIPFVIYNGDISTSTTTANMNSSNNKHEWARFTTDSAGDYVINHEKTASTIEVYDSSNGKLFFESNTSYDDINNNIYYKTKTILSGLSASKEYFVCFFSHDLTNTSCKVSVQKCEKNIQGLVAEEINAFPFTHIDHFTAEEFNYTVIYDDKSSKTFSFFEFMNEGFSYPSIQFNGYSVNINGEKVLKGGRTPFKAISGNLVSLNYLNVTPIYQTVKSKTVGEKEECVIKYADKQNHTDYYHLKFENSGMYGIYTYFDNKFSTSIDYQVEILDSQNNIIHYDTKLGAWPLIGGQDYVLYFNYTYKSGKRADIPFWFEKEKSVSSFPDVFSDGWYYNAVNYCSGRKLITGYQNGLFGVSDSIQRQDFLIILSRLDKADLEIYNSMHGIFGDVAENSYYEGAVNWGYDNGISTGYNSGDFGVGDKMTREQLVTFFYRYAKYKFLDVSVTDKDRQEIAKQYTDYSNVSEFAKDAVVWAIKNKVIGGKTPTTIDPVGNAQRCEMAQILFNIFNTNIF